MANVLVIDDDPIQQMLAQKVLEARGHAVQLAGDGTEGLEALAGGVFDVVVCDVVMPGLNGYQFAAALRADAQFAATPLLLLTSLAERAQVRAGMTAGADDYLAKPYRPVELVQAVESVLKRRRAQDASVTAMVQKEFLEALLRQEATLGKRDDHKLAQELGARWQRDSAGNGHQHFPEAAVLFVNLFGALRVTGAGQASELALRALQAARDTLYLFGAVHVMPYGHLVLAMFDATRQDWSTTAVARALRATQALQSAAELAEGGDAADLAVAIGLCDVSLIQLQDPLHRDTGCAALPTAGLEALAQLHAYAEENGWRVAAPKALVAQLADENAGAGRSATVGELAAVELLLWPALQSDGDADGEVAPQP